MHRNGDPFKDGHIYIYAGPPQVGKTTASNAWMSMLAVNKQGILPSLTVVMENDQRNQTTEIKNHNGVEMKLPCHDMLSVNIGSMMSNETLAKMDKYSIICFEELHLGLAKYFHDKKLVALEQERVTDMCKEFLLYLAYHKKKVIILAIIDVWITLEPVKLFTLLLPWGTILTMRGKCDRCGCLLGSLPYKITGIVDKSNLSDPGGADKWGNICPACAYQDHKSSPPDGDFETQLADVVKYSVNSVTKPTVVSMVCESCERTGTGHECKHIASYQLGNFSEAKLAEQHWMMEEWSKMNKKLRSAAFVSSTASRRTLCPPFPGTMLSQALSRL